MIVARCMPRDFGRVALGSSPAQTRDYHRRPMTHEQPASAATSAIGFGSGISDDHRDGIRWVDYANISWNPVFCKRCDICVEICPKDTLVLRNDAIIEEENCILCGLCERYCPDLAIEMIPEAVNAHAAREKDG
jgi:2-oxoglutarate ferredoxin oxidoreductase subunit delta